VWDSKGWVELLFLWQAVDEGGCEDEKGDKRWVFQMNKTPQASTQLSAAVRMIFLFFMH
jgi:hypothetical protein